MEERLTVAIDGPSGAGKSTVAKRLAQRLGYSLVDTGAIYRSVALLALERGHSFSDETALAALAQELPISFQFSSGENRVFLGALDVSSAIRTPEVSRGASQVSSLPGVRAALLGLQRRLGSGGGVVLEGRDIGTVVCPDAQVKFFLTASVEARARRRFEELRAGGHEVSLEETRREVEARDLADTSRAVAPLRAAQDAIFVDASDRGVEAVVSEMVDAVLRRSHG